MEVEFSPVVHAASFGLALRVTEQAHVYAMDLPIVAALGDTLCNAFCVPIQNSANAVICPS